MDLCKVLFTQYCTDTKISSETVSTFLALRYLLDDLSGRRMIKHCSVD